MERRLGHDFGSVRLHADSRAADSAAAVGSVAYTVGNHIVLGQGASLAGENGRRVLAHELVHTIQQGGQAPTAGRSLRVSIPSEPGEHEAERLARIALSRSLATDGNSGAAAERQSGPTVLMRQAVEAEPAEPMERPEVEEEEAEEPALGPPRWRDGVPAGVFEEIEGSWIEISRGEPEPLPGVEEPPLGEERGPVTSELFGQLAPAWLDRARWELERPVATLIHGGTPPGFITTEAPRTHRFQWRGATWPVTYRPRRLHVLDAIEYEVSRARTQSDLRRILSKHLGFWPERLIIDPRIPEMPPYFPDDLDPGAVERRRAYEGAISARIAVVPELATAPSAQKRRRRTKKGCEIEYGRTSLGGHAIADMYAMSHCRFGDMAIGEALVKVLGPRGEVVDSVQYDGVMGDTAYECKCGYSWLADLFYSTDPRKRNRALEFLENPIAEAPGRARRGEEAGLIVQMLHQQRVARECGLDFIYVVSSGAFAQLLGEWAPSLRVDCQSESACGPGCDEGPRPDSSEPDEPYGPRQLRFDR